MNFDNTVKHLELIGIIFLQFMHKLKKNLYKYNKSKKMTISIN